jgi:hypothetical protein
MAGHSPSKTGVNALFPAIHGLHLFCDDVNARPKAGHDGMPAGPADNRKSTGAF